jgi:hypothetical protein
MVSNIQTLTRGKVAVWVILVRQIHFQLMHSPTVVRNIFLVLGVDCVDLPFSHRRREERADEELGKSETQKSQLKS